MSTPSDPLDLASRLIALAYTLDDPRVPLATRMAYVKRELTHEAKALIVQDCVVMNHTSAPTAKLV